MKKALTIAALCALCAVANVASAETIWGVSDTWSGIDNVGQICSWDAYTGVFIQAPVKLFDIIGDARVMQTQGLAVEDTTAYLSYMRPDNALRMVVINLANKTVIRDVPLAKSLRGLTMSLDAQTLYGAAIEDDYIYVVDKVTGALTQKAKVPGDVQRWGTIVGTNPLTGDDWVCYNHTYYAKGDFDSTSIPYWGAYVGGSSDQPSAQCWRSDGVLLAARDYTTPKYTIMTRNASGLYPGGYYTNNPSYMPSALYNLETVNSFTFLAGRGIYAMSPVFTTVPEPATMGLLLMGGLAVLRRKRH